MLGANAITVEKKNPELQMSNPQAKNIPMEKGELAKTEANHIKSEEGRGGKGRRGERGGESRWRITVDGK